MFSGSLKFWKDRSALRLQSQDYERITMTACHAQYTTCVCNLSRMIDTIRCTLKLTHIAQKPLTVKLRKNFPVTFSLKKNWVRYTIRFWKSEWHFKQLSYWLHNESAWHWILKRPTVCWWRPKIACQSSPLSVSEIKAPRRKVLDAWSICRWIRFINRSRHWEFTNNYFQSSKRDFFLQNSTFLYASQYVGDFSTSVFAVCRVKQRPLMQTFVFYFL